MQTNTTSKPTSKISINNNDSFLHCDCRLDVYSRFLGPTVDQTILNCIELLLKLFNLFRCNNQNEEEVEEEHHEIIAKPILINKSQSVQSFLKETPKPNLIDKSQSIQSFDLVKVIEPPKPVLVDRSQSVQSFLNETTKDEPPKPLLVDKSQSTQSFLDKSLSTKATQTELEESTPIREYPTIPPRMTATSVSVCCSCRSKIRSCCYCTNSSSDCSSQETIHENAVQLRETRMIGDCRNECQCPFDVLYAITRITKYGQFTTYEIMKPTRSQPKRLPGIIDGVFVLRKTH